MGGMGCTAFKDELKKASSFLWPDKRQRTKGTDPCGSLCYAVFKLLSCPRINKSHFKDNLRHQGVGEIHLHSL